MRKKLPLLCLLAFVCAGLKAQLSEYYFLPYQVTYTPITGTAVTYTPLSNTDLGTTSLLPIGFTFKYNGIDYSQLSACTDGFIKLGTLIDLTQGSTTSNNLAYTNFRNIIAPLWDDLRVGANNMGLRYETSGTSPNRVFTLQWTEVYWNESSTAPVIAFQLKLYETTNRIEFIYNQLAAPVVDGYAAIGMNTSGNGAGSFLTLTDAGPTPGVSFEDDFLHTNKKPATGQVYAFFIPMPCSGLPEGGTLLAATDLVCPSSDFKLTVTGYTIAKNISYQWQSSADGVNWQDIIGATDSILTTQQTSDTYYRRAITCGGNTAYSTSLKIRTGVLPVIYATIPFYEDFETEWISNCALRERPSLNFKNSVPSGNRSWRRDDDAASGEWESICCFAFNYNSGNHAARFRVRDEFLAPVHTTGDLDLYVDCSPPGIKELRFRHAQSLGARFTSIWYSTDGGASFDSLGTVMGWNRWTDQNFIIPSNSPTTIIRFRGQGKGYAGESDIGIDDIRVQQLTCSFLTGLKVTGHHQNGITVQWNGEPGTAYEYRVTTDRDRAVGGIKYTTDTTVVLSGLYQEPGENFFLLFVRRVCGDTNFSSWAMIAFNLSADCSEADTISCGQPYAVAMPSGLGRYNLGLTDMYNGCTSLLNAGKEKLLKFMPPVTGLYKLKITDPNSSDATSHYLKDASKGCGPAGWTCLGTVTGPAVLDLGNLPAGKEYFLLIDASVFGKSQTIEIECAPANADCVTGAITPAGPLVLCDGESKLLTVTGGASWQWFRNGTAIDGANSGSYTAKEAGRYAVAVTNGTCTSVSNAVSIESSVIPAPVLNITNDTSMCAGQNIELSTVAVAGYTYQWKKNGAVISNATNSTYAATEAGLYTVTADNNCSASTSATVQVTVKALPAKPVITAGAGNMLISSAATGNQWYKDGVLIAGATAQNYAATVSGLYTVQVTVDGCSSVSAGFNLVVSGIVDPAAWNREVIVFPNPAGREIFVRNSALRQLHLRLMDMTGRTVYEGSLSNSAGTIALNNISVGVYQLLITDIRKRETIALRIIKH